VDVSVLVDALVAVVVIVLGTVVRRVGEECSAGVLAYVEE
jgi:hypothetical protein